MDEVCFDRWNRTEHLDYFFFQKLGRNKAQELSTTRIKVKSFTSGLCFNVHLDSMHPTVKLFFIKAALFSGFK